jgi:hypothetical protein
VTTAARRAAVVAVLALTACASPSAHTALSGEPPVSTAPAGTAREVWVGVLDAAGDPARLTAARRDVLAALGDVLEGSVVISPAACLEGLPADVGDGYVLAIQRDTRDEVRALASLLPRAPTFTGDVTLLCSD